MGHAYEKKQVGLLSRQTNEEEEGAMGGTWASRRTLARARRYVFPRPDSSNYHITIRRSPQGVCQGVGIWPSAPSRVATRRRCTSSRSDVECGERVGAGGLAAVAPATTAEIPFPPLGFCLFPRPRPTSHIGRQFLECNIAGWSGLTCRDRKVRMPQRGAELGAEQGRGRGGNGITNGSSLVFSVPGPATSPSASPLPAQAPLCSSLLLLPAAFPPIAALG